MFWNIGIWSFLQRLSATQTEKLKKTSQVEGDMPRLKHFDTLNPVEKACDMSVKKVKMQKQKKLNIRLLNKLHICAWRNDVTSNNAGKIYPVYPVSFCDCS